MQNESSFVSDKFWPSCFDLVELLYSFMSLISCSQATPFARSNVRLQPSDFQPQATSLGACAQTVAVGGSAWQCLQLTSTKSSGERWPSLATTLMANVFCNSKEMILRLTSYDLFIHGLRTHKHPLSRFLLQLKNW